MQNISLRKPARKTMAFPLGKHKENVFFLNHYYLSDGFECFHKTTMYWAEIGFV
jgi:hypothetical protein